ncbi:prostaglandin E2 receptor EP2 subtype-like isoform X1 [Mya arenaria]|uniref:prostaglandin E2 receptor EP2 subtype-like isoform X1 n=1 Tax=Mya arenaria TaxID=6604 RepID=UPI0022E8630B|nr:prostaglandin E2 receptor EP2 subtype-like isoform X1 [Mya arenaria]
MIEVPERSIRPTVTMTVANVSVWYNLEEINVNATNVTNVTIMKLDKGIDAVCDGMETNTSVCDKQGLGISLATPIAMLTAGVLGNITALVVLYTARNRMKKTLYFILLTALAWTDLICQLLVGPIAIIVYANNLRWVGGEPVCKYHGFFMVFASLITPLFVCCVSIERVLAITFPYFHERAVTRKKIYIVIACCVMFVTAFCCLPFLGFGSYAHQFPGSWCFLNFHKETESDTAFAYLYGFINVTIISLIIIMNVVVMVTLIKMRMRKLNNSPPMKRRGSSTVRSKLKLEEETQMMWFLLAMTVVFTTCWFPLTIHILINQTTGRVNYRADLMGVRLASINQILDPWLYILLRRSVIIKVFRTIKGIVTFTSTIDKKSRHHNSKFITDHDPNSIKRVKDIEHEMNGRIDAERESVESESSETKLNVHCVTSTKISAQVETT